MLKELSEQVRLAGDVDSISRSCRVVQVIRTLDVASTYGTVVLVTNAETGWIELSGRKFMPSLSDYLDTKCFKTVSARSTYEPLGVVSPFEWKASWILPGYYWGVPHFKFGSACRTAPLL